MILNKIRLRWVLIVLMIIALGFFREYIFVGINEEIKSGQGSKWLLILKWPLTIFFSLIYLYLTHWVLHRLFPEQMLKSVSIGIYFILFFISALFMGVGQILNESERFYTLSRHLMGIAQSPFILMILTAFGWVRQKTDKSQP